MLRKLIFIKKEFMNICLFTKNEIQNPLKINDDRAVHLLKILHKNVGDEFTAGIIEGNSGVAKITKIDEKSIYFDFTETGEGKSLFPLKMIIGFPRPIQLKRLLRDVSALGICEIHLIGTELGEKSYLKSSLSQKENIYKLLLDGTVQAGGTKIPKVFIHNSLRECLNFAKFEDDFLISLDNINPKMSLNEKMNEFLKSSKKNVVAAIGSERGWTNNERKFFEERGFILCGMGNRIMRTETAVTVAGAIILNSMGALQ